MNHAKNASRVYIDIGHGRHVGLEDFTAEIRRNCPRTHIVASHEDATYAEEIRSGTGVRHIVWLEAIGRIIDNLR